MMIVFFTQTFGYPLVILGCGPVLHRFTSRGCDFFCLGILYAKRPMCLGHIPNCIYIYIYICYANAAVCVTPVGAHRHRSRALISSFWFVCVPRRHYLGQIYLVQMKGSNLRDAHHKLAQSVQAKFKNARAETSEPAKDGEE